MNSPLPSAAAPRGSGGTRPGPAESSSRGAATDPRVTFLRASPDFVNKGRFGGALEDFDGPSFKRSGPAVVGSCSILQMSFDATMFGENISWFRVRCFQVSTCSETRPIRLKQKRKWYEYVYHARVVVEA